MKHKIKERCIFSRTKLIRQLWWSSSSDQGKITPVKCGVHRQQDICLICHSAVFGLKGQPAWRQRLGVARRITTFRPRRGPGPKLLKCSSYSLRAAVLTTGAKHIGWAVRDRCWCQGKHVSRKRRQAWNPLEIHLFHHDRPREKTFCSICRDEDNNC